jgi:dihydropteroate synthase
MDAKINENLPTEYAVNGRLLSFRAPVVMAIVNLTPDSFYDGGKYDSESDVLYDVDGKIRDGAQIIDIGGASSRSRRRRNSRK